MQAHHTMLRIRIPPGFSLHVSKPRLCCCSPLTIPPFPYRCENRQNTTPWDVLSRAKHRILGILESPRTPAGVQIAAIKFVQRVILVQSRGVSDPRVAQTLNFFKYSSLLTVTITIMSMHSSCRIKPTQTSVCVLQTRPCSTRKSWRMKASRCCSN